MKRFFCFTLITLCFFTVFSTLVSAAQPRVLPTNHYMANTIRLSTAESSATDCTIPSIAGRPGIPIVFRTFDQFTCSTGSYEVYLRIVKLDDNTIVASTNPIPFTATSDGYIYTQPAVWQVLFPSVGWYRYEAIANGIPIAYYYFVVSHIL